MTPSRMFLSAVLVSLAVEASIRVRAQDAPAKPQNHPVKMRRLLNEWERSTNRLETLDVHIYRIDKDRKRKDETHYEGLATFKTPNLASIELWKLELALDGNGRLAPKKAPNGEASSPKSHVERLVRAEDAVWQYIDEGRRIVVFPRANGEQQDILDEGPYPFLFKMKAKEAEERYHWSIEGESAAYYVVKAIPKQKKDQASFKVGLLYLHKPYLLPERILLVSPDGTRTWQFLVDRQRPNAPVVDQKFQGGIIPGWTMQKNLLDLRFTK